MTNLSVIILVGKEELHIRRCLEKLAPLEPRQVFIIESQTGDRTHEIAIETAHTLGWQVSEAICGNENDQESAHHSSTSLFNSVLNAETQRRRAEERIATWLSGVDETTFDSALARLVDEKSTAGEYLFETQDDKARAIAAAKSFFVNYSRLVVKLSDGRYVYFAPDPRARLRNPDNAVCWAEYAFHAVSSGGDKIPGKNYNYRKYNAYKVANTDLIEQTLRAEQCVPVLKDKSAQDAVKFFGSAHLGGLFDVVVRLDECGNVNANMTEVTFEASTRQRQKKTPQVVSLPEAIRTVVSHQTATGTYPPNKNSLANSHELRKGGDFLQPLTFNLQPLTSPSPSLSLVWHAWPGLYAKQYNWALDNLPIEGEWILRLDADEYLTPATIENLKKFLSSTSHFDSNNAAAGLNLELKRRFCGGEIRHATNGIRLLRIWRRGKGRSEERAMDEHIEVEGTVIDFDGAFYDDNLNDMDWWREKHRGYAKREARDAVAFARGEISFKSMKEKYYRMPRYFRAFVYFCIRYFLKRGFLDGYAGWMWNFWQGLWYRCLVDYEIGKLRA